MEVPFLLFGAGRFSEKDTKIFYRCMKVCAVDFLTKIMYTIEYINKF